MFTSVEEGKCLFRTFQRSLLEATDHQQNMDLSVSMQHDDSAMTIKELKNHYREQSSKDCISIIKLTTIHQIILIRHGEPDVRKDGLFSKEEAFAYKEAYKSSSIINFKKSPICVKDLPATEIFHSSLRRAEHTAELIFGRGVVKFMGSDGFVEFDRQSIGFPYLKMPIRWWNFLSRFLWFFGINQKDYERFPQARTRVKEGATILCDYASKHGIAILVAHGIYNKFLGFDLQARKWEKVYDQGGGYLAIKIFAKADD